jgi:hypothetical protein
MCEDSFDNLIETEYDESEELTLEQAGNTEWGTFGLPKDGDFRKIGTGPLVHKKLKDLSNEHLINILKTQSLSVLYSRAIDMVLKSRKENDDRESNGGSP